jgi:hypothetical protein
VLYACRGVPDCKIHDDDEVGSACDLTRMRREGCMGTHSHH